MARIVVGSWMVRYPLGGNLSWTLQWLAGFDRLGHEVYLAEKAGYPDSCFDPRRGVMSDDCSHGVATVGELLSRHKLCDRWCYVDAGGDYHGLSRRQIEAIFESADLFVDIGSHGAWLEEAAKTGLRILVDGEPGATQMKLEKRLRAGESPAKYDRYFSNGANVGTPASTAPTAGRQWRPLYNPVVVELFEPIPVRRGAPFTTVMNWQAHPPLEFDGTVYGQKDREFARFLDLPRRTACPLEIAVSGNAPRDELRAAGWSVRSAREVSISLGSYVRYLQESCGEFSVCKHVYVETNSGWFSDRSAAYLASGRPVVLQETGFSAHLPCGEGLFAVRTPEEAAAAIDAVTRDYDRHARAAREIAREHLDAQVVLGSLLRELGM